MGPLSAGRERLRRGGTHNPRARRDVSATPGDIEKIHNAVNGLYRFFIEYGADP